MTAALMALHALVFFNAARFVRPWSRSASMVAMDVVLIPMMLARPHLLAWPLIAWWTWLMLRARERDRAPPLAAALLMVIWANLHGSFVMALAIAGGVRAGGAGGIARPPPRTSPMGIVRLLACVAIFVNAQWHRRRASPPADRQFRHASADRRVEAVEPGGHAVLLRVLAATHRAAYGSSGRGCTRCAGCCLAALLALALFQVRHQAVLAIVAAMILPTGFASARAAGVPQLGAMAGRGRDRDDRDDPRGSADRPAGK